MTVHVPVLLAEVLELLALEPGDHAIDCTFGGGGYAKAMLEAIAPGGRLLAIDRDPAVVARGEHMDWSPQDRRRLTLTHGSFTDLRAIVAASSFPSPQAIVADLGLSSDQLADSNRGFSFSQDGPLDMRFDPTSGEPTAADLILRSTPAELERILRTYGEEPHARRIAGAIVGVRRRTPITTTVALADLVASVVRRRGRIHPATRTFQALRIAVNGELEALEQGIAAMRAVVTPGGTIAIVAFHSLEDRVVKRAFRAAADAGWGQLRTPKPMRPSTAEIQENPRSRSAKLRVITRNPHTPPNQIP